MYIHVHVFYQLVIVTKSVSMQVDVGFFLLSFPAVWYNFAIYHDSHGSCINMIKGLGEHVRNLINNK